MIAVICKSACLAAEIQAMAGTEKTVVFTADTSNEKAVEYSVWLEDCLRNYPVSVVFYEPSFFVDPSRFRAIRPQAQFVILSAPGDESDVRSALTCGAAAMLEKPVDQKDVRSVLSLVSP